MQTLTIVPAVPRLEGICETQKPSRAGNLKMTETMLEPAGHVSIISDGNESKRTFSITGLDRYGLPLKEDIRGPNSTTVNGVKNFSTIIQVRINGAGKGNISVGISDELESEWIPVRYGNVNRCVGKKSEYSEMMCMIQGTIKHSGWKSFDEHDADPKELTDEPVRAIRLKITEFVSGSVEFEVASER